MNHSPSKRRARQRAGENALAALLVCLLLVFFLLLLKKSAPLQEATREALRFSAATLVPALFPFAVLSRFLLLSRLLPQNSKPASLLSKPFFCHAPSLAAIASGLVCGFPMGAFAASSLAKENLVPQEEACRVAAFANNASPPFLLAVSGVLFGNVRYGILLYAACTLASLSVGILRGCIAKRRDEAVCRAANTIAPSPERPPLLPLLADCIVKAGEAMLTITAFVAFFSLVAKAASLIFPSACLTPFFSLFLEASSALRYAASLSASLGYRLSLTLSAFAVGWSGLSVIMQSEALFGGKLPLPSLLLTRLAIAALSALLTFLCFPLL